MVDMNLYRRFPQGYVRPLSLLYSDASADGVEERSLVPRSRSHARLRRNMTMSHTFLCVQPEFIDFTTLSCQKSISHVRGVTAPGGRRPIYGMARRRRAVGDARAGAGFSI
ncbi:hypothetical protein EVAR_17751_1 [Eumeta japonica]|uniref:Uncharacterized protein n=1 Tax=Eumeta variegata TaxID=151549 RepID=A0A4C1TTN1_EUMVA|nr:hypothetical protein EVAR_17751_1 [Eumeta japonica]